MWSWAHFYLIFKLSLMNFVNLLQNLSKLKTSQTSVQITQILPCLCDSVLCLNRLVSPSLTLVIHSSALVQCQLCGHPVTTYRLERKYNTYCFPSMISQFTGQHFTLENCNTKRQMLMICQHEIGYQCLRSETWFSIFLADLELDTYQIVFSCPCQESEILKNTSRKYGITGPCLPVVPSRIIQRHENHYKVQALGSQV